LMHALSVLVKPDLQPASGRETLVSSRALNDEAGGGRTPRTEAARAVPVGVGGHLVLAGRRRRTVLGAAVAEDGEARIASCARGGTRVSWGAREEEEGRGRGRGRTPGAQASSLVAGVVRVARDRVGGRRAGRGGGALDGGRRAAGEGGREGDSERDGRDVDEGEAEEGEHSAQAHGLRVRGWTRVGGGKGEGRGEDDGEVDGGWVGSLERREARSSSVVCAWMARNSTRGARG